jgi:hypothetical protein
MSKNHPDAGIFDIPIQRAIFGQKVRGHLTECPRQTSPPAEVFGVIETALLAHFVRAIEALTEE